MSSDKGWLLALVLFISVIGIASGTNEHKNLLIGGIGQNSDPLKNIDLQKFAKDNDAIYVPTYNKGLFLDVVNTQLAAFSIPTSQNGLAKPELKNQQYDTIFAYSGGTRSAVTAMTHQGVTADRLVLISPISALDMNYDKQIKEILSKGTILEIYQSSDDVIDPLFDVVQKRFSMNYVAELAKEFPNQIAVHNYQNSEGPKNLLDRIFQGVNIHKQLDDIAAEDLADAKKSSEQLHSFPNVGDRKGSIKQEATGWWDSISTWTSAWDDMVHNGLPATPERVLYTVGTACVLLLGISLIWRSLGDFIINSILGLMILYLSTMYLGIKVSVTAFTILVCAIGGIPGAILLIVMQYYFGIHF
ncbi:MAG: pro-sigmaK processing inhibitor BofA family protein [Methanothrix sp.]